VAGRAHGSIRAQVGSSSSGVVRMCVTHNSSIGSSSSFQGMGAQGAQPGEAVSSVCTQVRVQQQQQQLQLQQQGVEELLIKPQAWQQLWQLGLGLGVRCRCG
jgi:hypothetical protein